MFKRIFDRIPKFLKNKYFLTGLVFIVLMFFLDRNNMMSQRKLRKELKALQTERDFYRKQAWEDSATLHMLLSDSSELERVGREKYLMKRDSEDIYLIVRKPVPAKK